MMLSATLPALAYIDPTGGLPPNLWGMMLAAVAAAIGVAWAALKLWGKRIYYVLYHRRQVVLVTAVVVLATGATGYAMFSFFKRSQPQAAGSRRVLVLAFDGMDPRLLEKYMAQGRLPNFSRLARDGVFQTLQTTMPPQSPVAWATFITGDDPGKHGIFDFIKRDPASYMLDTSMRDRKKAGRLPWEGTPFWHRKPVADVGMVGLRVPVTFPPEKLNGRLLAGMGVSDVRGTEGQYFYYTQQPREKGDARGLFFTFERDGGTLQSGIPGPYHAGQPDTLREPFTLTPTEDGASLAIQGKSYSLLPDRWSEWINIEFRLGALGLQKVRATTRVILKGRGDDMSLYVSPLNFDPASPLYAISYPKDYSAQLFDAIGHFHTRGMPFDTQAVNDGVLSDRDFLEQARTVTAEGETMLFDELSRFEGGVLFAYFETPDIVQHMFWRGIDPEHPLAAAEETQSSRDAIPQMYEEFDALLGRARASLGQRGGTLVVISDHGFAPFRRSVHLNRVLHDLGYLAFKPGETTSGEFFDNVDWSKTRAYALGFNTVFINTAGREAEGIVPRADAEAVAREVAQRVSELVDPETGQRPIKRVYLASEVYTAEEDENRPDLVVGYERGYRASWETALGAAPAKTIEPNAKKWSGDHLIDAPEVPGIFLSSDPKLTAEALGGVGQAIGEYLQ